MTRVSALGRSVVAGDAHGPVLRLDAPISFWGGVDPVHGVISDPRHPQHGRSIAGTVLLVPSTVGSSSSSAVLLELIRGGVAPAAIVTGESDAILAVGSVVAGELGYDTVPIVELRPDELGAPEDGTANGAAEVKSDGTVSVTLP